MTIIIIAVLAILLTTLIVKVTKDDLIDCISAYVDLVKKFLTKDTAKECLDDLKHAGRTIAKASGQIFKALKLVTLWVSAPVILLLIPVVILIATIVGAYRK